MWLAATAAVRLRMIGIWLIFHISLQRADFDDEDREWLHHLVADWQVIADLSLPICCCWYRMAMANTWWPSNAVHPPL